MGASTGIVLTGTAISAGNDWYQTHQFPWGIGVAGLLLSGFMYGVEKLSEPLAVGLSSIFLITVLVTPIKGKNSPAKELAGLVSTGKLK
jgi:hypothetical protein